MKVTFLSAIIHKRETTPSSNGEVCRVLPSFRGKVFSRSFHEWCVMEWGHSKRNNYRVIRRFLWKDCARPSVWFVEEQKSVFLLGWANKMYCVFAATSIFAPEDARITSWCTQPLEGHCLETRSWSC